jgi:TatD DNase family protein
MVDGFVNLGGYFSISGYFAHERKAKQREAFKRVPPDRLLVETDAPDMSPPEPLVGHRRIDPTTGNPMNHPANLGAVYEFAAGLFNASADLLVEQVKKNFQRLFGSE